MAELSSDEVIVRVEKLTKAGCVKYTTEKWLKSTVAARLFKCGTNTSVHELITSNSIRFFLDVDGCHGTDIM